MIPFSDEDLQQPVSEIIKNKIAPMLAQDGGAIELIQIKDGKVFVQLQGACIGCPASGQTIKYGIERQLRIDIHPEIEVINIAVGMEDMIDEIANNGS